MTFSHDDAVTGMFAEIKSAITEACSHINPKGFEVISNDWFVCVKSRQRVLIAIRDALPYRPVIEAVLSMLIFRCDRTELRCVRRKGNVRIMIKR